LKSQFVTSSLRSQIVTLKDDRGKHRKYLPYVFTEQGVAMLSSVLKSDRAIEVNVSIIRAFVKLRHYVLNQSDINTQVADLRKLLMLYINKNDKRIKDIFIILNNLMEKPKETKRIGFNAD